MATPANHSMKWERQVQAGVEATFGTVAGTLLKLICESNPTFTPGLDAPKDTGAVGRGKSEEYELDTTTGLYKPTLTLPLRGDETLAGKFIARGLHAIPAPSGAQPPYIYTWNPPTAQPTVNLGMSFLESTHPGTANEGQRILGAITKSLSFSGKDDGSSILMTAEMVGSDWTNAGTVASVSSQLLGTKQWQFWDSLVQIDGTSIYPFAFDLKIDFNPALMFGNSQKFRDAAVGMFKISGSITQTARISNGVEGWNMVTNYRTKGIKPLLFSLGTAGVAGYFSATCDVAFEAPTRGEAGEGIETVTSRFRSKVAATSPTTTALVVAMSAALT